VRSPVSTGAKIDDSGLIYMPAVSTEADAPTLSRT
jgi:hypothetical protein